MKLTDPSAQASGNIRYRKLKVSKTTWGAPMVKNNDFIMAFKTLMGMCPSCPYYCTPIPSVIQNWPKVLSTHKNKKALNAEKCSTAEPVC